MPQALTPRAAPPSSQSGVGTGASPIIPETKRSVHDSSLPVAGPSAATATLVTAPGPTAAARTRRSRIPRVLLTDQPAIAPLMAARLAGSALGHVMFLKNQVPFPVMQLARIPGGKTNTKAARLRAELIASFDVLSSHLVSTFSALGTALARGRAARREGPPDLGVEERGRAYLVFVVGPSVSSARARFVFALEGLEVKLWGVRKNERLPQAAPVATSEGTGVAGSEDSGEDRESDCVSDQDDSGSEGGGARKTSEEDTESESSEGDSVSGSEGSLSSGDDDEDEAEEEPPRSRSPSPSPYSEPSHEEMQKTLYAAERLLARVLSDASAAGEDNGVVAEDWGISSEELAPTQTHVLLLAPRRFAHPSWTPRQNLSASLDAMLSAFLAVSEDADPAEGGLRGGTKSRRAKGRQGRVEGVWIESGSGFTDVRSSVCGKGTKDSETEVDDEMIWWNWDGKIVGFSDW